MKTKSIKELFSRGERGGEAEAAPAEASAAERLGRALIERLGGVPEGVTEDELVDALLENMDGEKEAGEETGPARGEEKASFPEQIDDDDDEAEDPFGGSARRPVPMRTGSAASAPVDYADMTAKQFNDLKKLLKKASADGKRITL
ncbi:MAG: hypothetical protein K6G56_05935 [Clostridiales bacterium]|nr:hypothetical protein [Clostridiales bacterium]